MTKIKKKVEMTLQELIEWAWKNGVKEKAFYSNLDGGSVYFDMVQIVSVEHAITKDETFTVEVEEEITEETELPKYLEIFAYENLVCGDEASFIGKNQSIKEILKENENCSSITKTIHLINDDETHTLIWKDGELVGDE
ncbi:hypothetical protein [Staphylococcus hominis]|uniref:hypothetical protein n=1 Tax=Staphylococcus hominis TaxID=1290 RepID=UPI00211F01BC|nr:hypothetical protein [Staphylococcus hominis]